MKKYLVLYEKSWMKNELIGKNSLREVIKKHCSFEFKSDNFRNAEYVETKEGVQIADAWILDKFIDQFTVEKYDGIIFMLEGERLKGRHGLHSQKKYFDKRFSVIQMEAKRGWYRVWKKRSPNKFWELLTTRLRSGNYKQIIYTFEHEIGHSLCWLYSISDILHASVRGKKYEEWWYMMIHLLRKYEQHDF